MTSSHDTNIHSSGSEDGGFLTTRYVPIIPEPLIDPDDPSPIGLAEPPPQRSLPPIYDKLYSSAVAKPPPGEQYKDYHSDGRPVKTGEKTTSERGSNDEGSREAKPRVKKRPPPVKSGNGPRRHGIRVAPLRVPLKRRLQTAAVLLHVFTIPLYASLLWFLLAIPLTWPILVPYLLYCLFSDAHLNGSSPRCRSQFLRSLPLWKLYTEYFPLKLHASTELNPSKNYIFTYHPHGIISHGAFGHFCTEGTTGFELLFPGITNTLLTLDSNFRLPFYRDYLLKMGLASVSRHSCEVLLRGEGDYPQKNSLSLWRPWTWWRLIFLLPIFHSAPPPAPTPSGGHAITIVLGGARESLEAIPGRMALVVKRRRGVLKIAIREKAGVVPVLSFGENDLYDQLIPRGGGLIARLQMGFKRVAGFTVPLFHARGVFNYDVGFMPYRKEVNSVVGYPIFPIRQTDDPRDTDVDELQERYLEELKRLWETHKDEYAPDRRPGVEGELMFVG